MWASRKRLPCPSIPSFLPSLDPGIRQRASCIRLNNAHRLLRVCRVTALDHWRRGPLGNKCTMCLPLIHIITLAVDHLASCLASLCAFSPILPRTTASRGSERRHSGWNCATNPVSTRRVFPKLPDTQHQTLQTHPSQPRSCIPLPCHATKRGRRYRGRSFRDPEILT